MNFYLMDYIEAVIDREIPQEEHNILLDCLIRLPDGQEVPMADILVVRKEDGAGWNLVFQAKERPVVKREGNMTARDLLGSIEANIKSHGDLEIYMDLGTVIHEDGTFERKLYAPLLGGGMAVNDGKKILVIT